MNTFHGWKDVDLIVRSKAEEAVLVNFGVSSLVSGVCDKEGPNRNRFDGD